MHVASRALFVALVFQFFIFFPLFKHPLRGKRRKVLIPPLSFLFFFFGISNYSHLSFIHSDLLLIIFVLFVGVSFSCYENLLRQVVQIWNFQSHREFYWQLNFNFSWTFDIKKVCMCGACGCVYKILNLLKFGKIIESYGVIYNDCESYQSTWFKSIIKLYD